MPSFAFHPIASLEVPQKFLDLMSDRTHNAILKRLLRWILTRHGLTRLPRHFSQEARSKYSYQPRQSRYMRYKARRFRSTLDLIKTGSSRAHITNPANWRITVGGSAVGGKRGLTGTLSTRFAFRGGTGRSRTDNHQRVTVRQMLSEVERFSDDEVDQINEEMARGYLEALASMPRVRRMLRGFSRI